MIKKIEVTIRLRKKQTNNKLSKRIKAKRILKYFSSILIKINSRKIIRNKHNKLNKKIMENSNNLCHKLPETYTIAF